MKSKQAAATELYPILQDVQPPYPQKIMRKKVSFSTFSVPELQHTRPTYVDPNLPKRIGDKCLAPIEVFL
jgi:hypothetical protein